MAGKKIGWCMCQFCGEWQQTSLVKRMGSSTKRCNSCGKIFVMKRKYDSIPVKTT